MTRRIFWLLAILAAASAGFAIWATVKTGAASDRLLEIIQDGSRLD